MKITFRGNTKPLSDGIRILFGDQEALEGKEVVVDRCARGFRISVTADAAQIAYHKPNDFFRALTIARAALAKGTALSLEQCPAFDSCGIMIDASRGAVPKVGTVKEIMKRMARMGLNRLMLYTEDVYELEKYPYFGYMRGRYTQTELREISDFGNQLGIESVPCIQTLAHLSRALRWPAFAEVRESPDILFIGEEKTYELIEEMIRTMRGCFTTDQIHIGMDEAHSVGLGRYLEKHGYTDRFALLSQHLERVVRIAEQYGFRPMMWSDMFFRLGSSAGDYYDMKAKLPERIARLIPKGVSQVYWDYYNHDEAVYETMIREHRKMECPIIFAGGVWTWGGPSVNYRQTFASTLPALRVCREQEIRHVFATMWGDDGSECDVTQALYGMQLYAECCYQDSLSEEGLNRMFRLCNGCDAEVFRLFGTEDWETMPTQPTGRYSFRDMENRIPTVSKQVLYQNPMPGLFDRNFKTLDLKAHYTELYERFEKVCAPPEFAVLCGCHRQLLKVLKDKCDMGIRIRNAYEAKDFPRLAVLAAELEQLAGETAALYQCRERLWYQNNKPFGFESTGGRLVQLEAVLRRAARRIRELINGEIQVLEELEEEPLYYNSVEGPFVHDYFASRIMMP